MEQNQDASAHNILLDKYERIVCAEKKQNFEVKNQLRVFLCSNVKKIEDTLTFLTPVSRSTQSIALQFIIHNNFVLFYKFSQMSIKFQSD